MAPNLQSQAHWELSLLRHIPVPAGAALPETPRSLWALVRDGSAAVETARGFLTLQAGDAVLINGRTAHRFTALEDADVVFSDLRLTAPTHPLPSPLVVTDFGTRHPGIASLAYTCPLDGKCNAALFFAGYAGLIGAAMTASWMESVDGSDDADERDTAVGDVVAALVARPGERWTLDRMAGVAHLSRSALTDRFRRATGRSPMNVLRDIRMQEARRLLGAAEPVTQVAFAVGYGSIAAFSRAFSARHGVAPHRWRDEAEARADQRQTSDAVRI